MALLGTLSILPLCTLGRFFGVPLHNTHFLFTYQKKYLATLFLSYDFEILYYTLRPNLGGQEVGVVVEGSKFDSI